MKCSLGISNFLEEISSLSHSVVFLYFFALITEEGLLICPCYSLELFIHMGISFLFSFAFHFSSFLSYLYSYSDSHFSFLHLFFLGMVLITVSCTNLVTFKELKPLSLKVLYFRCCYSSFLMKELRVSGGC